MYANISKEDAIKLVKIKGWNLEQLPDTLRDDFDIVLAAVTNRGAALVCASKKLRDNKEIVLAAVTQDGEVLFHASTRLKNDKLTALAAVSNFGAALYFVEEDLQDDMEVILTAIRTDFELLGDLADSLRREPAIVFMKKHGRHLKKADWPIIKQALLEQPARFLNPDAHMKVLTAGMKYPYLMLAQYILNTNIVSTPDDSPGI